MAEVAAVVNNTKHLEVMAQTLAVPRLHKPMRMPTFPAMERTAVSSHLLTDNLPVPAGKSVYALVARSPIYPVWATSNGPGGVVANSNFALYHIMSGPGGGWGIKSDAETITFPPERWGAISGSGIASGTWVNSLRWPVGYLHNGLGPWVYCPQGMTAGFQMSFNSAPAGASSGWTIEYECHNGSQVIGNSLLLLPATLGTGVYTTLTLNRPGQTGQAYNWFRVVSVTPDQMSGVTTDFFISTVYMGANTGGTMTSPSGAVDFINTGAMFPMFSPAEWGNSQLPYRATRETAAAALFSNVSSVLSKEGVVSATRVPMSVFRSEVSQSPWNAAAWSTQAFFTSPHPAERYYGPLEKGLYTFTLPDEKSERFSTYLDYNQSVYPAYIIDDFDYVHLIRFADLDTAGSTTLAVQSDVHLEFRTSSALFQLGYSGVTLESYHVSVLSLLRQGVFYENPTHIGTIGGLVGRAVSSLAPVMMPFLKGAAHHAQRAATAAVTNAAIKAAEKVGHMAQAQVHTGRSSMPVVTSRPVSRSSSVTSIGSRKKVVVVSDKKKKKKKK